MNLDSFEQSDLEYYKKWAFKIAMLLLVIGGINWFLIGAFRFNIVHRLVGSDGFGRAIYIIIGLCAIAVMFNRDFYLPFLGQMVAPCSVLQNRVPPGASQDVMVQVAPNAKVLYWAAEPKMDKLKEINDWKKAYAEYENAGVATANADGIAVLRVRPPQVYSVPWMGVLDAHVHYRVCSQSGWMDRVQTAKIHSDNVEAFDGF
jgi:uncharacterized membrane protein YuzA (DUF378 family)